MIKKRFFDTFEIKPFESLCCVKGANDSCPNHNIPKNCNGCEFWEAKTHLAYPTISSIRYLRLMKVAMRWGCIFSQTEDGLYNVYDNDEPPIFEYEVANTLEEAILLGLVALKEQALESEVIFQDVRSVFNEIS